jgi:protein-S-isoprenylcysteine O-methyltransferase Ste14
MDASLLGSAIVKFVAGFLIVGLLLFLPAGTLTWWRGWLLMGVLFVPMFVAGLVMMARAPDLLRSRLDAREEHAEQRAVVALSGLMFVAAFVVAGLGHSLGWPVLPKWASWVGAVAFLAAYALYAEVMRENAYLSRTIEVQEGQHVVDTGLYGEVGTVKDVLQNTSQDVYVVKTPSGREIMIPAVKEFIKDIDIKGGVLTVALIPGFGTDEELR